MNQPAADGQGEQIERIDRGVPQNGPKARPAFRAPVAPSSYNFESKEEQPVIENASSEGISLGKAGGLVIGTVLAFLAGKKVYERVRIKNQEEQLPLAVAAGL